jgi:Uncharacterised protein (DUF2406)
VLIKKLAAVALEESNLENLRGIQHKDAEGNLISKYIYYMSDYCSDNFPGDPDRSNPTRSRMERPLDTIRSFNAAAEGTSRSRSASYQRPVSQYGSEVSQNRRASYYSSMFPCCVSDLFFLTLRRFKLRSFSRATTSEFQQQW